MNGHEGLYAELFHNTYIQVAALQRILGDEQFERALDGGCGYGRMTPWIQEYCESYYGIDPYTRFLNTAREHFPQASFTETHASDLPFEDDYFDLTVAWNSLMYVDLDGLNSAAEEIRRVMDSNALLVVRADVGSGQQYGEKFYHSVGEYKAAFAPLDLKSKEVLSTTNPDEVYEATVLAFESDS